MSYNQLFIVDKPKNMTSNQVIQKIKYACKLKKIGHGGTLDPLATGVLIVGINSATKLLQSQLTANKVYVAQIAFGYQTTTYDLEGEITNRKEDMKISVQDINNICNDWKENGYNQQVPIYSAVKQNGQELYKLARQGQTPIDIPFKPVQILAFKIIDFNNNILDIEIEVSKGFYIRSFANDLGLKLGGYATLTELRRTKSGDFSIDDAYSIEAIIDKLNQVNVS